MPDDILAELATTQLTKGNACVRTRIAREHPELLESFDKVLPARQFSARSVAEWFIARGVHTTKQAIENHRLGVCETCRKTTS